MDTVLERVRRHLAVVAAAAIGFGVLVGAPQAMAQDDTPTDPGEPPVEAGVAPGVGVPDPRPGEAFADPKVAELQHTATDVQRELDDLAEAIKRADGIAQQAAEELSAARAAREEAEAVVAGQQEEVDAFSRSVYTSNGRPDDFRVLLSVDTPQDVLAGTSMVSLLRDDQERQMQGALDRLRAAEQAERAALGLEQEAAEHSDELDQRNNDAANRADAVSSELRGPIDSTNAAVIAQQRAQQQRNEETTEAWQDYLDRLDDAGITPPRAGSLRDSENLPGRFEPVKGADGEPQAGIAQVTVDDELLLVLPKETVEAVSAAVDALGKPYVPRDHGEGPTSYSCDGLVKAVFTDAGLDQKDRVSQQFAASKRVSPEDVNPGDLVFVGPEKFGVQHVGIALDEKTMLAADGRLASVAVTDMPASDSVLAVTRPALGTSGKKHEVPKRGENELTWRCGGVELPLMGGSADGGAHPGAVGAWGGYPNGMIPPAALCGVGVGHHALRCDAAQGYILLSQAFGQQFGRGLCITDSYRTFNAQVDLYKRKPALAAVPGTSNHGWGLAVDLCGGINSFGTAEYSWMAANAPSFGWVNPYWARPGGGREEPWHWEYVGM